MKQLLIIIVAVLAAAFGIVSFVVNLIGSPIAALVGAFVCLLIVCACIRFLREGITYNIDNY